LSTELAWEGKYDEYGDRRAVDAAGLAMPMQRIETIDEPRAQGLGCIGITIYVILLILLPLQNRF